MKTWQRQKRRMTHTNSADVQTNRYCTTSYGKIWDHLVSLLLGVPQVTYIVKMCAVVWPSPHVLHINMNWWHQWLIRAFGTSFLNYNRRRLVQQECEVRVSWNTTEFRKHHLHSPLDSWKGSSLRASMLYVTSITDHWSSFSRISVCSDPPQPMPFQSALAWSDTSSCVPIFQAGTDIVNL